MYLTQLSAQNKLEDQAQEMISEFTDLRDVQDYTLLALANAGNDAIEKILLEGGYLTDDLPPSMEGRRYLPYTYTQLLHDGRVVTTSSKVYYGVVEQVPCLLFTAPAPNILIENTSFYPVKYEWLENYYSRYNSLISQSGCIPYQLNNAVYSGFMGGYELPALCSYDGPNANNNAAFCGAYQYDYYYNQNAIQRQLEEYIQTNLHRYINVTYFERRGTNLSFDFNQSNITVFYKNPTGVVITLKFLAGVDVGGHMVEREVSFSSEIDGSFRQLHAYVQELLMKALKDPYFNISRDWNNTAVLLNYNPTFRMYINEHVCMQQDNCLFGQSMDDDIYTFVDSIHLVNNRPLTLNVAVQNRRPILDFIHDTGYDNAIAGYQLDKQYYTNATLLIDPYAIDPDLDNITYTYYGWKQNYNQYLNETCCEDIGGCNITNHVRCYLPTELILDDNPVALMNSELYRATNKSVSYQLNETDTGFHNITLVVQDEHGLMDFQIIKILVFDLPKAILNFTNGFIDINDGFASIEDFFILNASGSQASSFIGGGFSKIMFLDDDEPFQPPIIIQDLEYELPGEGYDITNITRGYFNFSSLEGETSKRHNVRLIVAQQVEDGQEIQSPPDIKELNVSECLPHGLTVMNVGSDSLRNQLQRYSFDEDISNTWPYPYKTTGKPSHICCVPTDTTRPLNNLSGGEFARNDQICFEKSFTTVYPFAQYGEMKYLRDAVVEESDGVLDADFDSRLLGQYPGRNLPILPTNPKFNDIYNMKITQSCSGNRGNVCSGEIRLSYPQTPCADITHPTYQFARCQMPGYYGYVHDYDQAGEEVNDASMCMNLNQNTFELNFYNSLPDDMKRDFLDAIDNVPHFDEELFLGGYCGTSDEFNLNENAELEPANDGVFECKATCFGTQGCSYTQNDECECNDNGDEECVGENPISANQFFNSDGKEYYVCKDDGACDRTCGFNSVFTNFNVGNFNPTKGACFCAIEQTNRVPKNPGSSYDPPNTDLTRAQIEYYFVGPWKAYSIEGNKPEINTRCCMEGVLIRSQAPHRPLCYDGVEYSTGARLPEPNLLFCNSQLYFCRTDSQTPPYDAIPMQESDDILCGHKCSANYWFDVT